MQKILTGPAESRFFTESKFLFFPAPILHEKLIFAWKASKWPETHCGPIGNNGGCPNSLPAVLSPSKSAKFLISPTPPHCTDVQWMESHDRRLYGTLHAVISAHGALCLFPENLSLSRNYTLQASNWTNCAPVPDESRIRLSNDTMFT